jgi:hypothetical protein
MPHRATDAIFTLKTPPNSPLHSVAQMDRGHTTHSRDPESIPTPPHQHKSAFFVLTLIPNRPFQGHRNSRRPKTPTVHTGTPPPELQQIRSFSILKAPFPQPFVTDRPVSGVTRSEDSLRARITAQDNQLAAMMSGGIECRGKPRVFAVPLCINEKRVCPVSGPAGALFDVS